MEQRGFPRPLASDKPHDFTAPDRETHIPQDGQAIKILRQAVGVEEGRIHAKDSNAIFDNSLTLARKNQALSYLVRKQLNTKGTKDTKGQVLCPLWWTGFPATGQLFCFAA
jgi:hypothetical protein